MDCSWSFVCVLAGILTGRCTSHEWVMRNETISTYMFSTQPLSWSDAKIFCDESDSSLLVVKSKKEQKWLQEKLKGRSQPNIWWIGLTYDEEEANWEWTDGHVLDTDISTWDQWEPDNGAVGQECVAYVRGNVDLNDDHCTTKKCFICYTGHDALLRLPVPFNYETVEFHQTKVDWKRAFNICRNKGWSLLKIGSYLEKGVLDYYILYDESECRSWWLDKDKKTASRWKWTNPTLDQSQLYSQPGSKSEYANENCAAIQNGFLGDYNCREKLPFICKREFTPRLSQDMPTHEIEFSTFITNLFIHLIFGIIICTAVICIGVGISVLLMKMYYTTRFYSFMKGIRGHHKSSVDTTSDASESS